MARLIATSKALFYPTPLRVVQLIADGLVALQKDGWSAPNSWSSSKGITHRLLDPCAGDGAPAGLMAKVLGIPSVGIELDSTRAERARASMDVVHCASTFQCKMEGYGKFPIVFLNPPYDTDSNAAVAGARQETAFLKFTVETFCDNDSIVVFIPPRSLLTNALFQRWLAGNMQLLCAMDFPEPERSKFNQVVLLLRCGRSYRDAPADQQRRMANLTALEPGWQARLFTKEVEALRITSCYHIPEIKVEPYDPTTGMADYSAREGAYATQRWRGLTEYSATGQKPLTMPRPGHRAMLLAAGVLDGADVNGFIVKGSSHKVRVSVETTDEDKEIERERVVSRMAQLDVNTGEVEVWTSDDVERTASWFAANGAELAVAINRQQEPRFRETPASWAALLAGLSAPGKLPGHDTVGLLPIQRDTVAALVAGWQAGESGVVLGGEMGVGKTTMGIATILLAQHARHRGKPVKAIVMCPTHLTHKWAREAEAITRTKGVAVQADSLGAVDRFFADPVAQFLILSKETAKLGPRWEPAVSWDLAPIDVDDGPDQDSAPKVMRVAACPRCGHMVRDLNGSLIHNQADLVKALKTRSLSRCGGKMALTGAAATDVQTTRACGETLLKVAPLTATSKTIRWPLARYIRERYARRYYLVVDEVHGFQGESTDQSYAMQDLASAAKRTLAMTGTLYGGRASSIFYLLQKCSGTFRSFYKRNEAELFCRHFGLHEHTFKTDGKAKDTNSVYGYLRTGDRVKEIPGMSPAMVPLLLPYTVFLKLRDLQLELPAYSEEVVLLPLRADVEAAVSKLQSECLNVLRKHPRALGAYLQACLGYPDRPDQEESITDLNLETGEVEVLATAPALSAEGLAKDERLVALCVEEAALKRRVLVYCTQNNRRDTRPRLRAALETAGLKVAVLDSSVAPVEREGWVARAVADGADVVLTNGKLVETGLDLIAFPTIVQFGIEYSVHTLRQSVRRSWRLGQLHPVKVVFMGYQGCMQDAAIQLIAKKMRAAELIDGDEGGGLAQHDEGGANLLLELAQAAIMGGA